MTMRNYKLQAPNHCFIAGYIKNKGRSSHVLAGMVPREAREAEVSSCSGLREWIAVGLTLSNLVGRELTSKRLVRERSISIQRQRMLMTHSGTRRHGAAESGERSALHRIYSAAIFCDDCRTSLALTGMYPTNPRRRRVSRDLTSDNSFGIGVGLSGTVATSGGKTSVSRHSSGTLARQECKAGSEAGVFAPQCRCLTDRTPVGHEGQINHTRRARLILDSAGERTELRAFLMHAWRSACGGEQ